MVTAVLVFKSLFKTVIQLSLFTSKRDTIYAGNQTNRLPKETRIISQHRHITYKAGYGNLLPLNTSKIVLSLRREGQQLRERCRRGNGCSSSVPLPVPPVPWPTGLGAGWRRPPPPRLRAARQRAQRQTPPGPGRVPHRGFGKSLV